MCLCDSPVQQPLLWRHWEPTEEKARLFIMQTHRREPDVWVQRPDADVTGTWSSWHIKYQSFLNIVPPGECRSLHNVLRFSPPSAANAVWSSTGPRWHNSCWLLTPQQLAFMEETQEERQKKLRLNFEPSLQGTREKGLFECFLY